jgi:iron(III) transport system substrate-binding protein
MKNIRNSIVLTTLPLILFAVTGCWRPASNEVVVYAALDSEFSGPVLDRFSSDFDLEPLVVFDGESTKTVGLFNRLRQERRRPRCDVFWNNEILHTILLEREGLLEPYEVAAGTAARDGYRSRTGSWTAIAARARVILVNTDRLPDRDEWPTSIADFSDAKWSQASQKGGYARPFFGTTKTHFLALYQAWGHARSEEFFQGVHEYAVMVDGNKQVAQAVARGHLAFGLTDTDDAIVEIENGSPVALVFPDQSTGGLGTLFIPNTIALLRDAPHPARGRKLIEFLVSEETERQLALGESAQFPVLGGETKSRLAPQVELEWMDVDFEEIADAADDGLALLQQIFSD